MRKLELKFRKLFSWKNIWTLQSLFKWHWLELQDYRKYMPWDEPKYINWKLSAKNDELFIKLFRQEKDALFHVFFDINSNWNSWDQYLIKSKIFDLFSDLAILSRKYWASMVWNLFDWKWKKHNFNIGKDMLKADWFIKHTKDQLKIIPLWYRSYLKQFLLDQKKIHKSHIIVIFSDFLDMDKDDMKLINALTVRNEILLIKFWVPDNYGYNYSKFNVIDFKPLNNKIKFLYLDELISW